MDFEQELDVLFRARTTLVCVVSFEEERIVEAVRAFCDRTNRALHVWDHADFTQTLLGDNPGELLQARDFRAVLEAIDKCGGERVFVLKDFHQCWDRQPIVIRKLRNLAQKLKYTRKTVILTCPVPNIPDELRDDMLVLEYPPQTWSNLAQFSTNSPLFRACG